MGEHDDDEDLRARLRGLPREVPPSRDLWPEVSRRIAASPRSSLQTRRTRLAAATVLGLAAAAMFAVALRSRTPAPVVASSASSQQPAPAPVAFAPAPRLPGDDDYQAAERALESELEARRGELPAGEARVVDDNLRILDDAIAATRAALTAAPDDPELRADLDDSWEAKLDLLQQASELPPGK